MRHKYWKSTIFGFTKHGIFTEYLNISNVYDIAEYVILYHFVHFSIIFKTSVSDLPEDKRLHYYCIILFREKERYEKDAIDMERW